MVAKQITIIGGGIVGLTTVIALEKIGVKIFIFEASPSIIAIGADLVLEPMRLCISIVWA
jgi:2-polyprenyl-6-methoxyphenol hydroxylase-like FAD-dependent oxidoreductase